MPRRVIAIVFLGALLTVSTVRSGIPEPDVVLYGQVFVNQLLQGAGTDLTVLARADGVANPIAQYRMGENQGVGDRFVLRLRIESSADGAPQSNNAARLGQIAHLLTRFGNGPEQPAADFVLGERARIQYLDLGARRPGDWNGDASVSLLDWSAFVECMRGPVPTSGQCVAAFDFDGNSTVDLADAGAFARGGV
jgi:hypothetical protein